MRDDRMVLIAKALADPTRLKLLRAIRGAGPEGMTCSDACALCDQSQPTVSHHLKTLESAGLIRIRAKGQFHLLRANDRLIEAFAGRLGAVPARARVRSGTARR